MTSEALGRFGHHPDPVIDFEIEVCDIVGEIKNDLCGIPPAFDIYEHVTKAFAFIVGGDLRAILAKDTLREHVTTWTAFVDMHEVLGEGTLRGHVDKLEAFRRDVDGEP